MNRRTFLARAVGLVSATITQPASGEAEVRVTLEPARTVAVIPPDFMGLGYEISSVARPGLLCAQNSVYIQLVRTLGASGVIRVGGNRIIPPIPQLGSRYHRRREKQGRW